MNSTIKAQQGLIAQALKTINPDIYNLCLELPKPMLSDFKHIPFLHYEFEHHFEKITNVNKHIFLACVYRMYNATHLYGKYNKLPIGLRTSIANVLGYVNPENVNAVAELVPAYYKNPRTAQVINDFADHAYNILAECGELLSGEGLSKSAQLTINLKALEPMPKIPSLERINIYSED